MEGLYPWIVFIHVLGAFTFVLAHGTSAVVVFRLRGERDIARVQALIELSRSASGLMYLGLLVLLVAGIVAAFAAGLWGKGWVWASLVLLVGIAVFMYARATTYFGRLQRASGLAWWDGRRAHEPEAPDAAALATLLASGRASELAIVGYAGLAVILWLMLFKPF